MNVPVVDMSCPEPPLVRCETCGSPSSSSDEHWSALALLPASPDEASQSVSPKRVAIATKALEQL